MTIDYRTDSSVSAESLAGLYGAVDWSAYTEDPARLQATVAASLRVVTAWDGERLVGLARDVGDGLSIVYLQDVLVAPDHQRGGVGRELLTRVFAPFADVRQKVLLTDDEPRQAAFYESLGFTEIGQFEHPLRAFVRFD